MADSITSMDHMKRLKKRVLHDQVKSKIEKTCLYVYSSKIQNIQLNKNLTKFLIDKYNEHDSSFCIGGKLVLFRIRRYFVHY
jgi:hypothetical protein